MYSDVNAQGGTVKDDVVFCTQMTLTARHATLVVSALSLAVACARPIPGILTASGTTEVIETDVAALVPARVAHIIAREGDHVSAGDTIARLAQSAIAPDIDLREARLAVAQAALRDLEAGSRPAEIERVRAELRTAQAEADRTARDLERASALFEALAISQSQLDQAVAAARAAAARRDAIAQSLALAQEGSREERIRGARAEVAAARAALDAAHAASEDLILTAPVAGVVLARHVEVGEIIPAGVPTVTLGDLHRPWVRVFVAAPALPRLRVGQEALAELQGLDSELFAGRIVSIDDRAQFTPRIALTEDERADLMFGVKVELATGTTLLKPGLPIDVHFDTTGTGFPARLTSGKKLHPLSRQNGG